MKLRNRFIIVVLLLVGLPSPLLSADKPSSGIGTAAEAAIAAASEPDYRIGPGDVLNIEVWKDATLTRLVTVLPDGKVTYPMVGEIMAAGRTVSQMKQEVEQKLSKFVKDSVITVEVRQVNSFQVYVLGKVKTPGRTLLTSNIDVLQALAMAGGPDQFAKLSRIRIFRREGGKTIIIPFDYDDVTAGKNLESNRLLRSGDVIFVP
jgi:polysaccharide export outer membrane protein